jgi:DMSO/TMAO reductase YedYZ molybdopterin-dependent catalytic subunit
MNRTAIIPQAIAGAVAAALAIGVSELVAGVLPGAPSLVVAIGQAVINLQPPGAKDLVVDLFGTNDKLALEVFIVIVAIMVAALLGIAARRRFVIAVIGFGIAAIAGLVAALGDPQASPVLAIVSAFAAAAVGLQTLSWLLGPRARRDVASASMPDWDRRGFLLKSGTLAVAAVVAAQAASIPPGAELAVPGITPLVVPNDQFYRIDTALLTPSVSVDGWQLRVHGMVDREVTLTYQELVSLPLFEQYVTIACVSNKVGGNLVGNAKWTGVHLRDVLDMAGVQSGATQLVGRSVDGWTAGMPTEWVMDRSRDPMIAVEMNDQPLPAAHGFPARLIVPGLFGYVSATKWLTELELTTLEAFDAYWIPLGWAKKGPILTQSRIDLPLGGSSLGVGPVPIAGVAWAPDRGVSRVEVGIDDRWREAKLSTPISKATWVQWTVDWDATPGTHTIAVRATDGTGEVQTAQESPPAPDGARGYHTITVTVS